MKTYSNASEDVERLIASVRAAYHPDIMAVTISALFVFDDEESSLAVLKCGGYGAMAMVRPTPLRDRALGVADAQIIIDRATWMGLTPARQAALLDHEITHIEVQVDKETGEVKTDPLGRPKLKMRLHDHQFGWFDEVARRHKEASAEVIQFRQLVNSSSGQIYWDFDAPPVADEVAAKRSERRQAEARH